jgi:excisionase family DNA binding protein
LIVIIKKIGKTPMSTIQLKISSHKLEGQKYISVTNIASYCMVTRTTVSRWIREKKIRAFRLPSGHFRVTVNDFKGFLEQYGIPVNEDLLD